MDGVIDNLRLERFCEIVNFITSEITKEQTRLDADTFNLARIAYSLAINQEKCTFEKYMEYLGLTDKPVKQTSKRSAKDIIAGANKTLEIMRQQKGQK